jgi:hypothetical protein
MPEKIELRPEVQKFAEAMELKLRENDHKPGWKNESPFWLFEQAGTEYREAHDALAILFCDGTNREKQRNDARNELVDTANFLMMTADVCGALK